MADFISYVKSTIDKMGVDIAEAYGNNTKFVDLDDTVNIAEIMAGTDSAIVWSMLALVEEPIAPLYLLNFGIGAKTTSDPGNYNMSDLLDAVKSAFEKGKTVDIRDWSPGGDSGVAKRGTLSVADVSVDPQLFDKASGIRLISVTARVVDDG